MTHDRTECLCRGCQMVRALREDLPCLSSVSTEALTGALDRALSVRWPSPTVQIFDAVTTATGYPSFPENPGYRPPCWRCRRPAPFGQIVALMDGDRFWGAAMLLHCVRHQPSAVPFRVGHQIVARTWFQPTEEFRAAQPVPLRQRLREWLRIGA